MIERQIEKIHRDAHSRPLREELAPSPDAIVWLDLAYKSEYLNEQKYTYLKEKCERINRILFDLKHHWHKY